MRVLAFHVTDSNSKNKQSLIQQLRAVAEKQTVCQTPKTTVTSGSTLSHACDVYTRTKGKGRGKLFFTHTDLVVGYTIQCLGNKDLGEYTTIDAGEFRDWLFAKGLKRS